MNFLLLDADIYFVFKWLSAPLKKDTVNLSNHLTNQKYARLSLTHWSHTPTFALPFLQLPQLLKLFLCRNIVIQKAQAYYFNTS